MAVRRFIRAIPRVSLSVTGSCFAFNERQLTAGSALAKPFVCRKSNIYIIICTWYSVNKKGVLTKRVPAHIAPIRDTATSCLQTDVTPETDIKKSLDEALPARGGKTVILSNMLRNRLHFDSRHSEIPMPEDGHQKTVSPSPTISNTKRVPQRRRLRIGALNGFQAENECTVVLSVHSHPVGTGRFRYGLFWQILLDFFGCCGGVSMEKGVLPANKGAKNRGRSDLRLVKMQKISPSVSSLLSIAE